MTLKVCNKTDFAKKEANFESVIQRLPMSVLREQQVTEIHFQANSSDVTSRSPSGCEVAHGEGSGSLPAVVCTLHQPARGKSVDALV